MNNQSIGNFFPAPGRLSKNNKIGAGGTPYMDSVGNMCIRGAITTDEGSVREDFSGTTIYSTIAGTSLTFTNGSNIVTGIGTTFTDGTIAYGDNIKLSTDADTYYAKVQSIISDTRLELIANYGGSTGTGTGYLAKFKPIIGTGGSIGVANSVVTIGSGTTTASKTEITREIDYGPLVIVASASVSQRIANQTGYIGLVDDALNPTLSAWFMIDGITNTTVKTVTQSSASANDTETNTVTLPNATTTATTRRYRIELAQEYCSFYIDDVLMATHKTHLPGPYASMDGVAGWVNGTTPASNTNIVLDQFSIFNVDALQILGGFGTLAMADNIMQIGGYPVIIDGNGRQSVSIGGMVANANSNGQTNWSLISAGSTNATVIKASAGRIHSIVVSNDVATKKYLKIYNKATAPTVGTDTPTMTIGVPANQTVTIPINDLGIYFSTGIGIATTALNTVADATAITAGDLAINISYV